MLASMRNNSLKGTIDGSLWSKELCALVRRTSERICTVGADQACQAPTARATRSDIVSAATAAARGIAFAARCRSHSDAPAQYQRRSTRHPGTANHHTKLH